mmetsp:Transcript_10298/g.35019  ORF Transcript_10298/g.35019 Transcript_10298/m.35019 type:complete len:396 (+) Transcript_10298:52-1239(+)
MQRGVALIVLAVGPNLALGDNAGTDYSAYIPSYSATGAEGTPTSARGWHWPFASEGAGSCGERHAYVDLGVNWANTARLYEKLVPSERLSKHWEVFGFEASPLIQPYADDFFRYLNGDIDEPLVCLPRAGSTTHLSEYARRLGCDLRNRFGKRDKYLMKNCMFDMFRKPMLDLKTRRALNSSTLIHRRLAASSCEDARQFQGRRAVFTLVPAAASGETGWMRLSSPPPVLIRGGAFEASERAVANKITQRFFEHSSRSAEDYVFSVPTVDVAGWLAAKFKPEDYVVVKMDIEGGEHSLLQKLMRLGRLDVLDVLAMECHDLPQKPCAKLLAKVRRAAPGLKVIFEGEDYEGIDAYSGMPNATEFAKWRDACNLHSSLATAPTAAGGDDQAGSEAD